MSFNSLRPFMSWRYPIRLIVLICGLFLIATGIVCTYRSALGLGPWDVLHQGISHHTRLSFGTATIVVGAFILWHSNYRCRSLYPPARLVAESLSWCWYPSQHDTHWYIRRLATAPQLVARSQRTTSAPALTSEH